MTALLTAVDVSVQSGTQTLVQGVSFELHAGQTLTVLGESGSGKSLMAQAVMATLPAGLVAHGEVRLQGRTTHAAQRRAAWGRFLALLPQEPGTALDPTQRALQQVAEVHRWLGGHAAPQAARRAADDLQRLGLPPATHLRYPHQLSGGMAQRVALAATLAGGAPLVVADEPTKGLDTRRRDQVVRLLQAVQAQGGAVLVITHDVEVARQLGGQVMVMRDSAVVEQGDAQTVLCAPRHAYTRELLAADPSGWPPRAKAPPSSAAMLVHAQDVTLVRGDHRLFHELDLLIRAGERWALQGPSGVGKTSLGDMLLGLVPPNAGMVRRAPGWPRHAFQKLYQDPLAAFAPRVRLRTAMDDLLRRHGQPATRLHDLRQALGLPDSLLERLPSAVSGGELQRLALLRVLLLQPALLFADEPTSRLDPLTQRDVLGLLQQQLDVHGTALVLVTHDAALAAHVADHCVQVGNPTADPGAPAAGSLGQCRP